MNALMVVRLIASQLCILNHQASIAYAQNDAYAKSKQLNACDARPNHAHRARLTLMALPILK